MKAISRRHGGKRFLPALLFSVFCPFCMASQSTSAVLEDQACKLEWKRGEKGWALVRAETKGDASGLALSAPSGEYTLLYSATPVEAKASTPLRCPSAPEFPEDNHTEAMRKWLEGTSAVSLNTAGESLHFYPGELLSADAGKLVFRQKTPVATLEAVWEACREYPGDVLVTLRLEALKAGYFSLSSPTLATFARDKLAWAMVPGVFAGKTVSSDFLTAWAYGQGLPDRPVLARERTASTLLSLATQTDGLSLAVVAEPGMAQDPWESAASTRGKWKLGLSHMTRKGELSPTLWHPVLGQEGSLLKPGQSCTFSFRYVLRRADWYSVLQHAAYDVYKLRDSVSIRRNEASLSTRLLRLQRYLTEDATSRWRVEEYKGYRIGAQRYGSDQKSGVVGSDGDAMKNSDYGAMWMLAKLTADPRIVDERLPYARAFKLVQQQSEPGFFQGAAVGQYYLFKSKHFVEEWGSYVEPVGLTYYTLSDFGNILLFSPDDKEARDRLKLGAEKLLSWQKEDGSWEVAYDRATQQPLYRELRDYRPTFYGLLIAWKILGDEKYLAAAKKGADWLVENAVVPQRYLGVCGDIRFAPDFATVQIAQALLDLADATGEAKYREAGIAATRFYVTSVFTHPTATHQMKTVKGKPREDWEISQTGLGFEHGGTLGSATGAGPIMLASHAGLFLRVYGMTGDVILRDLARAAALGRDAFADPATGVVSYYWAHMNAGSGPFPHHAWWQVGWITDYLLSEVTLRSAGKIEFPRGFFTPKVGPHASYGFAPGKLFGDSVSLGWGEMETGSPHIEHLLVHSTDAKRHYVILLNDLNEEGTARIATDAGALARYRGCRFGLLDAKGKPLPLKIEGGMLSLPLAPYGLAVLTIDQRP